MPIVKKIYIGNKQVDMSLIRTGIAPFESTRVELISATDSSKVHVETSSDYISYYITSVEDQTDSATLRVYSNQPLTINWYVSSEKDFDYFSIGEPVNESYSGGIEGAFILKPSSKGYNDISISYGKDGTADVGEDRGCISIPLRQIIRPVVGSYIDSRNNGIISMDVSFLSMHLHRLNENIISSPYEIKVSGISGELNYKQLGAILKSNANKYVKIELDDSVSSIRGAAFYGCNNLVGITIPYGTITVNDTAFQDCPNLKVYLKVAQIPEIIYLENGILDNGYYNYTVEKTGIYYAYVEDIRGKDSYIYIYVNNNLFSSNDDGNKTFTLTLSRGDVVTIKVCDYSNHNNSLTESLIPTGTGQYKLILSNNISKVGGCSNVEYVLV